MKIRKIGTSTYIKCHSGDYHAGTNGFYENVRSRINKYPNINNTNDIWFEYSDGIGGIVLRFNMHEFTYSGSTGHTVEYSNMNAFLRYKVSLYNGDGGVQAAYGHKQLGIGGISVSLTTGSIGLSFAGTMAKYYGEPLSIYEYK